MNEKRLENDYKFCMTIWHLFRDYGDVSNTENDERRWEEIVKMADEAAEGKSEPMRAVISSVLWELEDRARAKTI